MAFSLGAAAYAAALFVSCRLHRRVGCWRSRSGECQLSQGKLLQLAVMTCSRAVKPSFTTVYVDATNIPSALRLPQHKCRRSSMVTLLNCKASPCSDWDDGCATANIHSAYASSGQKGRRAPHTRESQWLIGKLNSI